MVVVGTEPAAAQPPRTGAGVDSRQRGGRAQRWGERAGGSPIVFIIAAAGCGAAGAVLAVSQPFIQPTSVFSLQWAAEMLFVSMIGGLGTIEGPISARLSSSPSSSRSSSTAIRYLRHLRLVRRSSLRYGDLVDFGEHFATAITLN